MYVTATVNRPILGDVLKHKIEELRISLVGGLTLAALTLLSGYLVYAVMQKQTESILGRSLDSSLQNNQSFFSSQINHTVANALSITQRPFAILNLQLLDRQPKNIRAQQELRSIAQSLLQVGYAAASITDSHGNEVARAGSFVDSPELSVPLRTATPAFLLWDWQYVLQVSVDVVDRQGKYIGKIVTETHMPQLDAAISDAKSIGSSAELAMCAPLGEDMQCFPLTISHGVTQRMPRVLNGKPLPMSYALDGKTGTVYAQDYREINVVAAHAPVGTLGMGMVLKIDQDELYSPVRQQLKIIIPLLAVLVVGGMLLLHWQVTPLVRKLVRSERATREANERLRESETKLQVMLDSSEVGIAWADENGRIEYANPKFVRMFGYTLADVPTIEKWYLRAFPDPLQRAKVMALWDAEVEKAHRNNSAMAPIEQTITCKDGHLIHTILAGSWAGAHLLATFSDITERKQAEVTIQHQANFDPLTQLPNRRLFLDRLHQEIKKSHRSGLPMALLFLDIDRFKEVNDSLGHDMGDILLVEAAQRLLGCVRETDTVARMGGDEFTIILGELADAADVERVTQDILGKLACPFQLGNEVAYVSGSIGITLYPADATETDVLLKNADQAMYAAKNQGRNRYNYFTSAMQEAALMRQRITSDLRGALAGNQFVVYYQPVVELASGVVRKAEALIRWQHPLLGRVNPTEFIAIAEETGMIIDIGNWVFREAARQAAHWRMTYHEDFQISINKSPVQFHEGAGKHEAWIEYLHQLGLPGKNIVVEITEGLLLNTDSTVTDKLLAFSAAGIQVSLDDFGTGYSSLSYLKKLDIDYLKIDQSFVRNLAPGSDDMALCEAMIVMAHKLGMEVIAEGVETRQQLDLLLAAGCDFGQGFLFSPAVSAEEFEALLFKGKH
jgi:diguanylate cyclase (GGDEF)-like protein/PAS domain S-box-containing protein